MMKLENVLNAKLQDTLTGFTGTGYAYAVYATGCNQVCLVPKIDKDGKRQDAEWFDIERIIKVGDEVSLERSPTGGTSTKSETPPIR